MLFRYPGSKAKIWREIWDHFPMDAVWPLFRGQPIQVYCEPFVGSAAVAWQILRQIRHPATKVIFNDFDPYIASIWLTIRDAPKELIRHIKQFTPSVDAFFAFKEQDGDLRVDPVLRGFRKLALHQTSFSGAGCKAGGPIGGKQQSSEYNVHCRWNPVVLAKKIKAWNRLMHEFESFKITSCDFSETLASLPDAALVYLDPPYYVQGDNLYKYSMSDADHARLADQLRVAKYRWVASYDDHSRIRELYSFAHINSFTMTPTTQISSTKRRKNSELVITNF